MEQFEYRKDAKLGKSVTPSSWLRKPDYTPITRIRLSCGGGMGGSSWYEYIERLENIPSNEVIKVKRYDGKEIYINTSWVVMAEDFKLAEALLEVSEWEEFTGEKISDNGIKVYYVLLDDDAELELVG